MLEPENVSLIEVLINSSLVYSYQLATLFLWGLFFFYFQSFVFGPLFKTEVHAKRNNDIGKHGIMLKQEYTSQ